MGDRGTAVAFIACESKEIEQHATGGAIGDHMDEATKKRAPGAENPDLKKGREPDPDRPLGFDRAGPSLMDVAREPQRRWKGRAALGITVLGALILTVWLARLEPAVPTVDRNVLLLGTVERGTFAREVRGPGTLAPEEVVHLSAVAGGRVEQVHVRPGAQVAQGAVLLEMTNPDVELEHLQAQQQLTQARAGLLDLRRSLGSQLASQEAAMENALAEYEEARRRAEMDSALAERELIPANEAQRSREVAGARQAQLQAERRGLELLNGSLDEQLAIQEEQVQQLTRILESRRRRLEALRVTAPSGGVLQDLNLQVGQWVQSGTTLARVAHPDRLMAELRIPEVQARDVQIGQPAVIDTRSDQISGVVRRVDPNVQNAAVVVEVSLEGDLPPGARPDLNVDGVIEVERLEDVLHLGRPAQGQSHTTVAVFRMVPGRNEAVRVPVRLGRSSVNRIEIVEGLEEGDVIILSDMSRWDEHDRVRVR